MKRIFALFVVFLLVILTCACSTKKGRVLVAGMDDCELFNVAFGEEYELKNETLQDGDTDRTYEVVINGKTYTGQYQKTLRYPYFKCDTDIYLSDNGEDPEVEFRINRDTDKLVGYTFAYRKGYAVQSGNKSYDECYQIALNELEKHLNGAVFVPYDQDEYREASNVPEFGDVYQFFFREKAEDAETNITVWMDVNTDGLICFYSAPLAPSLDSSEDHRAVIKAYNDPASLNLIDKKIRSICSGDHDPDKLSWTVEEQYVSKLKSGEECVQYQVVVTEEGSDVPNCIRLLLIP